MQYYDYKQYFQSLITNQNSIISIMNELKVFLSCFLFIFICFFLYFLIRNMIKNK